MLLKIASKILVPQGAIQCTREYKKFLKSISIHFNCSFMQLKQQTLVTTTFLFLEWHNFKNLFFHPFYPYFTIVRKIPAPLLQASESWVGPRNEDRYYCLKACPDLGHVEIIEACVARVLSCLYSFDWGCSILSLWPTISVHHRCDGHRRLQSRVGTRARLGYATFDAQLRKAYFVTTLCVHKHANAI